MSLEFFSHIGQRTRSSHTWWLPPPIHDTKTVEVWPRRPRQRLQVERDMDLSELNRRLVANAILFEDPRAYAAGVTDALDAVHRLLQWDGIAWGAGGSEVQEGGIAAGHVRLESS